ncbi:MAG: hypothetical protein ACRDSZ_05925 [Pseudonocardiaceae bacterium]
MLTWLPLVAAELRADTRQRFSKSDPHRIPKISGATKVFDDPAAAVVLTWAPATALLQTAGEPRSALFCSALTANLYAVDRHHRAPLLSPAIHFALLYLSIYFFGRSHERCARQRTAHRPPLDR